MWPAASKLSRLRPLGRASNFQRIQYYNLITRGLAISPDFAEIFPAYVEANGGNAVVPNKLAKTPENEAKHAAWSEIHKSAAAFRKRYLDQTLSQEDFEQLEAMDSAASSSNAALLPPGPPLGPLSRTRPGGDLRSRGRSTKFSWLLPAAPAAGPANAAMAIKFL